ncbi:hypothetical protein FDP41_001584 [Naegleria fowleri]|uniref:Glucosamine 6-phosphate N-acetyltransferase n=1 Tax=Naegleria fowleri TaxID=5763 RepID=A0A6A5BXK8_NAEFO|nr:uncharacterized protein FDP41_001584 [Naegleria fowleri]KAF0979241.1 hypothetical protein FDP41_001584 [Naegleria fowleri]
MFSSQSSQSPLQRTNDRHSSMERRLVALRNHCSPTMKEASAHSLDITFNAIDVNHTAGETYCSKSLESSSSECCSCSHRKTSTSTTNSSPQVSSSSPSSSASTSYQARPIEPSDYEKGYLTLLSQLTTVGDISRENFLKRLSQLDPNTYRIVVIEDPKSHRIVAAATVFVEKKFVHECGSVGHIEDVVVDANVRGQHLGVKVIEACKQFAQEQGCYKTILDCSEKNVKFYEKCGFVRKEIQMRFDHEH